MQNRPRRGGVRKLTGKRRNSASTRAERQRGWALRCPIIAKHPDLFDYSWTEEVVHAVTHGLGAVLSMAGLVILILAARNTGNPLALAAATVYGMTLVFCYVSSALYHGVSRPRLKRFFLLLDHAAIYLLIAGTYTPIALLLPIERGWIPVAVIWGLAAIGIMGKVAAYRSGVLVRNHRLSTLLYVGMGWSGLALGWDVLEHLPGPALGWLVAGGLLYSLGAVVFLAHHIKFHHALWHVMALVGSACHFWLVLSYVLPSGAL
jgi:hemolysin III